MKRDVPLSTTGTIQTMVRFFPSAGCGNPRIASVEDRDPNNLVVDHDIVAFEYFDRLAGEYKPHDCETKKTFRSLDMASSGLHFVEAKRAGPSAVTCWDGRLHSFEPGRDKIVARRKLVVCQLSDGTQKVVSAEAVNSRGNRGRKMIRKLARKTVFYQVFVQLCGNQPSPLTPRIYIRGATYERAEVCSADGSVPTTVLGLSDLPDEMIIGFVRTGEDTNCTYWAVYPDDVVQSTVKGFELFADKPDTAEPEVATS